MKKGIDVVAALILNQGKYLVTQRLRGSHLEYYWEFPGGKCEVGETYETALKREIREELDIHIMVGPLRKTVSHEYKDHRINLYFYACQWTGGELMAKECAGFRWLYPHEMRSDQFPPADQELIRELTTKDGSAC